MGLFSRELIFGGLIVGENFAFQNGLAKLDNEHSLKHRLRQQPKTS